jgi:hypothetical protein
MKTHKAFLAATLALTGCAQHYAAPTNGPTATLTLSAAIEGWGPWLLVQKFQDEHCAASPNGTRLATFTTKSLQGKGDPHTGVAKLVPAGQPTVFSYVYQDGAAGFTDTESCIVTQSFVPEAGAKYRATFRIIDKTCVVSVAREDGPDPKAVDALHKVEPPCNNGFTG